MPSPFAITAATNTAMLDARREGAVTFTVTNISGRALRGRANLVTVDPKGAKWLSIAGEAEREFNIAQTEQYTVKIAVPPDGAPGSYPFHLDMVGTDNPDENFTPGQQVTFQVPAEEVKPKPFPWWILVVAAVVLVVLACVAFFLYQTFQDSQGKTAATQTAVAATATRTAVVTQFNGCWVVSGAATAAANAIRVVRISTEGSLVTLTAQYVNGRNAQGVEDFNGPPLLMSVATSDGLTRPFSISKSGSQLRVVDQGPAGVSNLMDLGSASSGPCRLIITVTIIPVRPFPVVTRAP